MVDVEFVAAVVVVDVVVDDVVVVDVVLGGPLWLVTVVGVT